MGDHVFLKVMPKRELVRFSKRGKLSPRYVRPFKVLEKVGEVAYRLEITAKLIRCSYDIPCLYAPKVHSISNSCTGLERVCCWCEWNLRGGTSTFHG